MPVDATDASRRLLQLASSLDDKRAEVRELRTAIRNEFSSKEYRSLVDRIVGDDGPDESGLKAKATATGSVWRISIVVVLALLAVVAISWLAALVLAGAPRPGDAAGRALASSGVGLLLVLAGGAAGLLLIGCARSVVDFDSFWVRIEKVLQSGTFYFFAGFGLLLYAIHASNHNEHPSLTFLLAMLGLAIMLFGTGSQAAGALATAGARLPGPSEARGGHGPETGPAGAGASPAAAAPHAHRTETGSRDWSPVKANAAIAGGAAVLTAIFGVGVIVFSKQIRDVFSDFDQYERISVEACADYRPSADGQLCEPGKDAASASGIKLDQYDIQVQSAYGTPIYAHRDGSRIVILVFRNDRAGSPFLRFVARRWDDDRPRSQDSPRDDDKPRDDYKKELRILIPLEDSRESVGSAASPAACFREQAGSNCRLARVHKEADASGRIKTSWYTLNFANDPFTVAGNPIEIQR